MTTVPTETGIDPALQAACEAFSGGAIKPLLPFLTESTRWKIAGYKEMVGRDAILAFCEAMDPEGDCAFSNERISVSPGQIVIEGRTAPQMDESKEFCDVFSIEAGKLTAVHSYLVGMDREVAASEEKPKIEAAIARFDAGLAVKDSEAFLADYLEDVISFDIGSQHEGLQALKEMWGLCLPYFKESIEIHRKETKLVVGRDVAVFYGYSRLTGMEAPPDNEMARSWIRMTICYQRTKEGWKAFHEHCSFPVDCESEKVAYIFD